jgi:hypothetical protein
MTAPKRKARRGSGLVRIIAFEVASVLYRGLPLFVIGFCLGLAIGLEGRL